MCTGYDYAVAGKWDTGWHAHITYVIGWTLDSAAQPVLYLWEKFVVVCPLSPLLHIF